MKLVDLTWYLYRIPFRRPFITAHGRLHSRSGALVRVRLEDGSTGNGEIAPLPEFAGSGLSNILKLLPGLSKELRGREISDVLRFLASANEDAQVPGPLACGLETALLEALARAEGQSLAALLAPGKQTRQTIPSNAVMSGDAPEALIEKARAALAAGFTCLKLKVSNDSQRVIECVAGVRATLGPVPRLRLDANEGWSFEQARTLLLQCAVYDIEYVEQPLPANEREGMARLRRATPIPLAADEAVNGLEQARSLLKLEAADILVLKPQMLGGLHICRQIIQEAYSQQVRCVITSTLDSGIGVAATLQLAAASPEITLACGLATLDLLESDLLQNSLTIRSGEMELPTGPGLGVQVDQVMLQRYIQSDTF